MSFISKKLAVRFLMFLIVVLSGTLSIYYVHSKQQSVVAKINNQKVTEDEYQAFLTSVYGEKALDLLIEKKLIEIEAERQNITVTDGEIEDHMTASGKSRGELIQIAAKNGVSQEMLYEQVKNSILLEKIVRPTLPVLTDEFVRDYYERNKNILYVEGVENPTFEEAEETIRRDHEFVSLEKAKGEWIENAKSTAKIEILID